MIAFPVNRHRIWQLVVDGLLVVVAWKLTFWLRFDTGVPFFYRHLLDWETFALVVAIKLTVFVLFGFYNRWWRYVSTRDMWGAARGVVLASVLVDLTLYAFPPAETSRLPRGVALIDTLLLLAFVAGTRLLARTFIERPQTGLIVRGKEVLIVGAGDAARLIIGETKRNRALGYTPIGLIDDDPRKKGIRVDNILVMGTIDDLGHIIRDNRPDEVLIAIPSAPGEVRQRVVDVARANGVPVKTLPSLPELISGDVNLAGQIREVQVEDILGREPVEVDLATVASYLAGRTVLVTGAGGSIGAELCRQVARVGPSRLILLEQNESSLHEIERELVDERGFPAAIPILGDVRHRAKIRDVFTRYRPDVVFHAAAYKHVHLMEANPLESVRTNVLGTKVVADVAAEFDVARFVLISTDKAANPKNVYGQCKAICEWVAESYGRRSDIRTRFVVVRFGNVLNSSGSVVPIFRKQIARGGPVRVTHPDMTRYFMTIPEAVSLVVQAGAIGGRGDVFVLDMGEPIKIVDLARNMIRLSGKEPDRDVAIEFVGVRPGEKLHEELWNAGEEVAETVHPKIMRSAHPALDSEWLDEELAVLERLVEEGDTLELVARLQAMVSEPKRAPIEATVAESTS